MHTYQNAVFVEITCRRSNLVVKNYHNVTTHGVIGLDGTSYFLANPKSAEKQKLPQCSS